MEREVIERLSGVIEPITNQSITSIGSVQVLLLSLAILIPIRESKSQKAAQILI
jgi:hypothetical protein